MEVEVSGVQRLPTQKPLWSISSWMVQREREREGAGRKRLVGPKAVCSMLMYRMHYYAGHCMHLQSTLYVGREATTEGKEDRREDGGVAIKEWSESRERERVRERT